MPNPLESLRLAKKRINPEGLAFGAAASLSSPAVLPATSAGVTYLTHEFMNNTDADVAKAVVIGMIALLNVASVAVESRALKENKYSASPTSSGLYILTGKPLISSIGGHALNFAQISVFNPVNLYSAATSNNELLMESEASALITLAAWFTALNTLVVKGKTQPFVDGVKNIRQSVAKKFKKN